MTHRNSAALDPAESDGIGPAGEFPRSTEEDWSEEACRQARALATAPPEAQRVFSEFRRKVAAGETISRAMEKLAEALRFSGRVTLTFHQGKLIKTVLEESYFRGKAAM